MTTKKNIAIVIPARGGSKRLELKNLRAVCGFPLFTWGIWAAIQSKYANAILISSENKRILKTASNFHQLDNRVHGVHRPDRLATDDARIEDAVEHAIVRWESVWEGKPHEEPRIEIAVLVQANIAYRRPGIVDQCVEYLLAHPKLTSVVTARRMREHPFLQKEQLTVATPAGSGEGCYEIIRSVCEPEWGKSMYRSQDFPKRWMLDGSVQVIRIEALIESKREMHGYLGDQVGMIEQHWWEGYEVEDIMDILVAEEILKMQLKPLPFISRINEPGYVI